ncbi:unnamed protein product [marine sediment metagenome]|uniref:Uncharacterized protein n=1 Tax=marine sediment metagenome TaxID=412755 RepID=X0T548_9ZZZZ
MDWAVVIFTVISAGAYGIIFFFKAWMTQDPKPPFDNYKFGATLVVAVVIGLIAGIMGSPLTELDFLTQIAAYAGYIAMVETFLKAIFGKAWPTSYPES